MIYLCDSELVLEEYLSNENISLSNVFTCSPNIIRNFKEVNQFDARWDTHSLKEFQESIKISLEKIDSYLDDQLGKNKYTALITSVRFFRDVYKLMGIDQKKLDGAITQIKYKNSKKDPRLAHVDFRWKEYLEGVCRFSEVDVELSNVDDLFTKDGKITLIEKLKLKSMKQTLFKIGKRFIRGKKGKVYFYRENELLNDALAEMFFNGYEVQSIKPSSEKGVELSQESNDKILQVGEYIFETIFKDLIVEELVPNSKEVFKNDLIAAYKENSSYTKSWSELVKQMNLEKDFIFCGYTSIPAMLSLAALDKRPALVSFQHGISKELSDQYDEIDCMSDGNISEVCFFYNNEVRKVEEANRFFSAKAVVSGASSSHHKIKRKNKKAPPKKIVYLSTNLYRGNLGLFVSSENDSLQSEFEYELVKNSLSKIDSGVDYKAYPMTTLRYLEKDYVLKEVIKHQNINLVEEKKDVRYFLRDYNLIITTHATSTLSWPVFSDIPTVFIDKSYNKTIKPELKDLMSEALFVFDESEENFHELLADFINSDLDKIESAWKAKEASRKKLVDQYFSTEISQKKVFLNTLENL